MNNISNSPVALTVEGFQSESHVYGIGCKSYDTINIFIPSKNLLISKDGSVRRSEHSMPTKKTEKVLQQYIRQCNNKEINFDQVDLDVLMKKANEETGDKVQISLNLVDELEALVSERSEIENKKKLIDQKITDLSSQFFG